MTKFGKIRHTGIAALLVAALAGLVGVGVAHESAHCDCGADGMMPVFVLPKIEVVAERTR